MLYLMLRKYWLVGEAQTCAIPSRTIQDNLHLIRYILDRIVTKPAMGGALIRLDQSEAFDSVDHHYPEAVLEAAGLVLGFRGWISTIYSDVQSSVQVNGYLSETFNI